MSIRIHILGPSGAGTSTLGEHLAKHLKIHHLDTDDFYWKDTEIPYSEKNPPGHRIRKILSTIQDKPRWVLSGSLMGWGDPLIPLFTHVIYLWIPWEIRKQRLILREGNRYGPQGISPGGDWYAKHQEFMEWAENYDSAGSGQRSRMSHEVWLSKLPESIHQTRFEKNLSIEDLLQQALNWLQTSGVG